MHKIENNGKKYEPLAQEKSTFTKILEMLSPEELEQAELNETYKDMLMGPGHDSGYPIEKKELKF